MTGSVERAGSQSLLAEKPVGRGYVRLSKQTSDAVKILTACARERDVTHAAGATVKVAALADEIGITKQLGLKLVNALARLGYVETVRGPKGGLKLSRAADAIKVGSVVRDLEALRSRQEAGNEAAGGLEPFLDDAFAAFVSVLDAHTIADLAAAADREDRDTARDRESEAGADGNDAQTRKPTPSHPSREISR